MILLDGESLTLSQLVEIARNNTDVSLAPEGRQKVIQANQWLESILKQEAPVYGINTGFGIFADKLIQPGDIRQLSRNLILSHSVPLGEPLPGEIVRAGMLVRANALVAGHSGVRIEVVERLLEMLNKGVIPVISAQGSLGSSGDLCFLSQMALVLTTDKNDLEEESGQAVYNHQLLSGKAAMQMAGLERTILGAKEGLALSNGASFCAGLSAIIIEDLEYLIKNAIAAMTISLEALRGCSAAFDQRIHDARRHPGQKKVADLVNRLIDGSKLIDSSRRVQDAYSLRCTPQVLGPVVELLSFIKRQVEREINAATDNPLLFENNVSLSGGNFHGEILGMAMDYAGIAMAEMGAISERRIYRLLDSVMNDGLPPMLVDTPQSAGLNSGYMMLHYTAAALVLENQTLAHPDSVHSLPTSAGQEDHNANAWTAASHAKQILDNVRKIIAIEYLCAARALSLRMKQETGLTSGNGSFSVYKQIINIIPMDKKGDQWLQPMVLKLEAALREQKIIVPGW
ncbi:MAG TPA: histidine ammonia-lyase [Anaerolineaceae bacterium]|nr:histidine ammonia-lyase [Anaerolineaceae bacterium]